MGSWQLVKRGSTVKHFRAVTMESVWVKFGTFYLLML